MSWSRPCKLIGAILFITFSAQAAQIKISGLKATRFEQLDNEGDGLHHIDKSHYNKFYFLALEAKVNVALDADESRFSCSSSTIKVTTADGEKCTYEHAMFPNLQQSTIDGIGFSVSKNDAGKDFYIRGVFKVPVDKESFILDLANKKVPFKAPKLLKNNVGLVSIKKYASIEILSAKIVPALEYVNSRSVGGKYPKIKDSITPSDGSILVEVELAVSPKKSFDVDDDKTFRLLPMTMVGEQYTAEFLLFGNGSLSNLPNRRPLYINRDESGKWPKTSVKAYFLAPSQMKEYTLTLHGETIAKGKISGGAK